MTDFAPYHQAMLERIILKLHRKGKELEQESQKYCEMRDEKRVDTISREMDTILDKMLPYAMMLSSYVQGYKNLSPKKRVKS